MATVRELVTRLGFSVDSNKLAAFQRQGTQAAQNMSRGFSGMEQSGTRAMNSINSAGSGLMSTLSKLSVLATAAATVLAGMGAGKVMEISDTWSSANARIQNVSKSIEEAKYAQEELFNISQRTRAGYEASATLYTRISANATELNATQKQILQVTENVNKGLIAGGASGTEMNAVLLQLAQGLGSGALRGDELNAILENSQPIAAGIAKHFGVSVGKLREMGADGKLLSKDVFQALLGMTDEMNRQFGNMPMTFSGAMQVIENSFGKLIDTIGQKTGVFRVLAEGFASVGKTITDLVSLFALDEGGNAFYEAFDKATPMAQELFTIVQTLKPYFQQVVDVLKGLSPILDDIRGSTDGILPKIVEFIKTYMPLITMYLKEWVPGMIAMWNWIKAVIALVMPVLKVVLPIIGAIILGVLMGFMKIWAFIVNAVTGIINLVVAIRTVFFQIMDAIINFCMAAWEVLKTIAIGLINSILELINNGYVIIQDIITAVSSFFGGACEAIKGFISGIGEVIYNMVIAPLQTVMTLLGQLAMFDFAGIAGSIGGIFGGGGTTNTSNVSNTTGSYNTTTNTFNYSGSPKHGSAAIFANG